MTTTTTCPPPRREVAQSACSSGSRPERSPRTTPTPPDPSVPVACRNLVVRGGLLGPRSGGRCCWWRRRPERLAGGHGEPQLPELDDRPRPVVNHPVMDAAQRHAVGDAR